MKRILEAASEHKMVPGIPWDWDQGICDNLNRLSKEGFITEDQIAQAQTLMCRYAPHRVGFPVQTSPDAMHGRKLINDRIECFFFHEGVRDMYTGTYGRSRRELCLFIAENLP